MCVTHDIAVKFLKREAKDLFKKAVAEWKKNVEPTVKAFKKDHHKNIQLNVFNPVGEKWFNWIDKNIYAKGYDMDVCPYTGQPVKIKLQSLMDC